MTHKEVLDEVNVIYERISQHSKDYDSAWSDGKYTEALEILIDYYEVGLVEELKKIKAEIENMWIKSAKDLKTGKVIYENLCEHSEVLEIIDKHISELKGEQE